MCVLQEKLVSFVTERNPHLAQDTRIWEKVPAWLLPRQPHMSACKGQGTSTTRTPAPTFPQPTASFPPSNLTDKRSLSRSWKHTKRGILGNIVQPSQVDTLQSPQHPILLSSKIVLPIVHFHIHFRISLLLCLKTKTAGFQSGLH